MSQNSYLSPSGVGLALVAVILIVAASSALRPKPRDESPDTSAWPLASTQRQLGEFQWMNQQRLDRIEARLKQHEDRLNLHGEWLDHSHHNPVLSDLIGPDGGMLYPDLGLDGGLR